MTSVALAPERRAHPYMREIPQDVLMRDAEIYRLYKTGDPYDFAISVAMTLQLLEEDATYWFAWYAAALHAMRHHEGDKAFVMFERALQFLPKPTPAPLRGYLAEIYYNLALNQQKHGMDDEAERNYWRSLDINPNRAAAWSNLGNLVLGRNKPLEAMKYYRKAGRIDSDDPNVLWNRGLARLLLGDLKGGFADYAHRFRMVEFSGRRPDLTKPEWTGEAFHGTLLVHAEQGAGDTIHFMRYLPLLRDRATRIALQAPAELHRLLAANLPDVQLYTLERDKNGFVVPGEPLAYDRHIPLLTVPHVMGTTLETVPAPIPYLAPVHPHPRLPHGEDCSLRPIDMYAPREVPEVAAKCTCGLRIGFAWGGNPLQPNDFRRSIPFDQWRALLQTPGCTFYSLQVGSREAEAWDTEGFVRAQEMRITDFADTFGVLSQLDLLISVDTSTVHLAGAMGLPVWCLVTASPDWRWLLDRDDSPWYPTLRLYRQRKTYQWGEVMDRVARDLRKLAA